jgi:hypothetical protein
MAQATVQLVVEGLANLDSLMPASADADSSRGGRGGGSAPNQQNQPETRVYKGATYVKGADGQWYLQKN